MFFYYVFIEFIDGIDIGIEDGIDWIRIGYFGLKELFTY